MISAKVTEAIHILLTLDAVTTPEMNRGANPFLSSDFGTKGSFQRSVVNGVLRKLTTGGYLRLLTSRRFELVRAPETVTVLELIQLFHGDVCFGEAYDHLFTFGYDPYFGQSLVSFESPLKEMLSQKLAVPISLFRPRKAALETEVQQFDVPMGGCVERPENGSTL